MILVDTSVWIDHLRTGNPRLVSLLEDQQVLCHPFIIGELAVGSLQKRSMVLGFLRSLPSAVVATHDETLHFIEERRLYGTGLSWVDAHLLASAVLTGTTVWSHDRALTISLPRLSLHPGK